MAQDYDPSAEKVADVQKKLEKADDQQRKDILRKEAAGKQRSTLLEGTEFDPTPRVGSSTGRVLLPHEGIQEVKDGAETPAEGSSGARTAGFDSVPGGVEN